MLRIGPVLILLNEMECSSNIVEVLPHNKCLLKLEGFNRVMRR